MKTFLTLIITLLIASPSLSSSFEEGIKSFHKKEYKKAIRQFEKAIQESPNDASSYFNLGLSFQKLNLFGKSIWAFEKASKLTPNDIGIKAQIETSYTELGRIEEYHPRLNRMQSALFGISSNQWSIIAIITSILVAFCLILFARSTQVSSRRLLLTFSFLLFCVLILSTYTAKASFDHRSDTNNAIVTKPEIPIFSSEKEKIEIGKLLEGTQLYKLKKQNNLISVESVNGEVYLINPNDVEFI
ncbi:MAG: tetratricopeptide repeat protein [Crocinitomicaceae bacterium]|nr:tetratricopeptide repeat protein [Crocinitomicaceae bacterium]